MLWKVCFCCGDTGAASDQVTCNKTLNVWLLKTVSGAGIWLMWPHLTSFFKKSRCKIWKSLHINDTLIEPCHKCNILKYIREMKSLKKSFSVEKDVKIRDKTWHLLLITKRSVFTSHLLKVLDKSSCYSFPLLFSVIEHFTSTVLPTTRTVG